MLLHARILTAGLLAVSLPAIAVAQVGTVRVPGQPVPGQPVPGQPAQVQLGGAAANVAADNQQQIQQVIAHALKMAICGSELQLASHSARGDRRQNQGAGENNQGRRDDNNNAAANDRNRRADDRDADNRDQGRRDRDNNADDQGRLQAHRQAVQLLQQQAWHQFQEGTPPPGGRQRHPVRRGERRRPRRGSLRVVEAVLHRRQPVREHPEDPLGRQQPTGQPRRRAGRPEQGRQ